MIKKPMSTPVVKKLGFSIPNEDQARSIIKNVAISGREQTDEQLLIHVKITPKLDTVILWDIKADIEIDSYDVQPESQLMFDSNGEIYILEKDHVVINNSGCRCFSYELEGNAYFNQWK